MKDVHVLMFSATWCAPCKAMKPQINEIITDTNTDLMVEFIDIDTKEGGEKLVERNVRNIPTLIKINEEGKEVSRISGMKTKSELRKWLED